MTQQRRFHLSEQSTLLTPEAQGMAALLAALGQGQSFVARQSAERPIQPQPGAPQMFFCESSGSTGAAKTVRRHPENWIISFEQNARSYGLGPDDTYATLGHPGHSLTLFATLEALHLGADLAALYGRLPKSQVRQVQALKVSVIYATPTQLRLLVAGARAAGIAGLPSVRRVFCGGGKLDAELRGDLLALCPGAELREFFGASETSFITISDAATPVGSVGRAYPGVTIRIGAGVKAGETGEIWVSSPYLFDGYAVGGTAETRRDGDFLSIGEMGYQDHSGNLFLRGRVSRMVTVSDVNVFPEEIEQTILRLPEVTQCAALAVPDARRGHQIVCFLQAAEDADLEPHLRRVCRDALGSQAVPRRFVFVADLPMLPAGKPDLQALQRHLEEGI